MLENIEETTISLTEQERLFVKNLLVETLDSLLEREDTINAILQKKNEESITFDFALLNHLPLEQHAHYQDVLGCLCVHGYESYTNTLETQIMYCKELIEKMQ